MMTTFSSPGDQDQGQPSIIRVFPIDMIIFKVARDICKVAAKGVCRLASPPDAAARLSCLADSAAGRFEGEFLAAGTKASGS
jgi:hypothetical protein